MKRFAALVLAVALILCGCRQGTSDKTEPTGASSESTEPSQESTEPSQESTAPSETTAPTLPSYGTTQVYTLCGLSVTLTGTFQELDAQEDYVSYYSDKMSVDISFGAMSELSEGIASSREFAEFFHSQMTEVFEEEFEEVILADQPDVSYVLLQGGEIVRTLVYGFYVCGDVGWTVAVNGYEPDLDVQSMIDMATSGVIDEAAIPELPLPGDPEPETQVPTEDDQTDPFVPELPEPGNVITFRGLTLHLDTSAEPTDVSEKMLWFTCDGRRYDITYGTMEELMAPVADSEALAYRMQEEYLVMWDSVSVAARNGVSYVICRDEDDFSAVVVGYVSGERWWTISTMGYTQITDQVLDMLTAAVTD